MANIITVSREFGSGGRELAKRLADILGYDYYDKEILNEICQKYNLNAEFLETTMSKEMWKNIPLNYGKTLKYSYLMQPIKMNYLIEEKNILEKIAANNRNCIIVGRNADVLLKDYNPYSIFVCANLESKIERCLNRMTEEEKKTLKSLELEIKKIDKARAKTREMITESKWGDRSQYNLIINTTGWNLKQLSIVLSEVINKWFGEQNGN